MLSGLWDEIKQKKNEIKTYEAEPQWEHLAAQMDKSKLVVVRNSFPYQSCTYTLI